MKNIFWLLLLLVLAGCSMNKKELALVSTHISASSAEFEKALKQFGSHYTIKIYDPETFTAKQVQGADLVIFESFGSRISLVQPSVDSVMARTKVYFLDTPGVKGNADESKLKGIAPYWENANVENYKGMLSYIGANYFGLPIPIEKAVEFPKSGYYHPASRVFFKTPEAYMKWYKARNNRPAAVNVGLVFYQSSYVKKDLKVIDALIKSIEAKGANAITYLAKGKFKLDSAFSVNGFQKADVVIYGGMFLDFAKYKKGLERAQKLDVPILVADVDTKQTIEEWRKNQQGFLPEKAGRLYFNERDGAFEPMIVGAKSLLKNGDEEMVPIPEQIEWRVNRAIQWGKLRKKANADKKIVITYYSEGSGKANVGSDSDAYLNAQRSLIAILKMLKEQGYNLGSQPVPDEKQLTRMMSEHASNIGVWAPQETDRRAALGKDVIRIPLSQYKQWFSAYSTEQQKKVLQTWGIPPGKVMVSGNHQDIIIPVIRFGNITLAPHPNWGMQDNKKLIYGNDAIPPSHEYIAFYEWLKHSGTDAYVTLFTQLSLMPGKNEGPSSQDFVGRLIGNMPHITMTPLMAGSAVKNKRRANALSIGYMNEVMAAGLPPALQPVNNMLEEWSAATNPNIKNAVAKKLLDFAKQNPGKFGNATNPELTIGNIRSYLQKVAVEKIPNGTHTLGEVPIGEKRRKILEAMMDDEVSNFAKKHKEDGKTVMKALTSHHQFYKSDRGFSRLDSIYNAYSQKLDAAGNELTSLGRALCGRYIMPGPSDDLVRNPESLPSGRNPYGGNDKAIPSQTAWKLGQEMADALLQQFGRRKGKGQFPKKVAFVLWSTEITNSQGATEAEILYLLGVRPVWNKKGEVIFLQLIPRHELGRPRIDVLLTTSGTYRDHFRDKINMLEQAVKLAAKEKEKDNSVRMNSESYARQLGINLDLASARIFSTAPGAYSTNLEFASEDENADGNKISALYMSRMSNSYGKQGNSNSPKLFALNIRDVDAAAFSRSSHVLGIMDHPMVAAYYGAISAAVKSQGGVAPEMFINDLASGDANVEGLETYYHREMDSRYLNPEWIKGMMNQGYDGVKTISGFTENLLLWNKTNPEMVKSEDWEEVYKTYITDQNSLGTKEFFDKNNPYALQTLSAHMIEAARDGYWKASERQLQTLGKILVESVNKNGPACSGSVCNSPQKMDFIKGIMEKVAANMNDLKKFEQRIASVQKSKPQSGSSSSTQNVEGYQISEKKPTAPNKTGKSIIILTWLLPLLILFSGIMFRILTRSKD